ncbi:MAG: hypothetical protein G8237_05915 [Magnetococcales bacterium]|nr:hypothetical protein [Magnetococcales bacterium]NGZ05875.1 hypothetical protein [Magnetococcales bacterium]
MVGFRPLVTTGLLIWLWGSGTANAGLFCVVDFAGKRCDYPDIESCRRAAGRQGGCVLNEGALLKPVGGAPFCLVESWRTECIYMDRPSCELRAAHTRTVCVEHPNRTAGEPDMGMGGTGSAGEPSRNGYLPSPGYRPGVDK